MPTSSVNIATQAGIRTSLSSLRMRRTSGSGVTSAERLSVTMRGWLARTSRAGPQVGSRSRQSWVVGSAGPTMEEQRRSPCGPGRRRRGRPRGLRRWGRGWRRSSTGSGACRRRTSPTSRRRGARGRVPRPARGTSRRRWPRARSPGWRALPGGRWVRGPGWWSASTRGGLTMRSADFRTLTDEPVERRSSPQDGLRAGRWCRREPVPGHTAAPPGAGPGGAVMVWKGAGQAPMETWGSPDAMPSFSI